MYNRREDSFFQLKKDKALHIDTDALGITFCKESSPIQEKLSPFPSPSSSTSSTTNSPTAGFEKGYTAKVNFTRSQCQLRRQSQQSQASPLVDATSYEGIKSPAAMFLASFASPTFSQPVIEEEQTGDEIDDFVLDKIVGHGGFSTVRKGFRISDGTKVAVKIVKKDSDSYDARLERELSIWKSLDHPHIVSLEKVLETDSASFLICDYCAGGNLLDQLSKNPPMSEEEARVVFIQICLGVQYLHEKAKVCHKDLKLENILFDEKKRVKICDYGLAIHQQPAMVATQPFSPEVSDILSCAGGSLAYASPEQIKSPKAITCPSADIWSLGIILYALVTGKLPFADDYELRLQQKVLSGEFEMPDVSEELQDLINHCLALNPEKRLSIGQILNSSWCKN